MCIGHKLLQNVRPRDPNGFVVVCPPDGKCRSSVLHHKMLEKLLDAYCVSSLTLLARSAGIVVLTRDAFAGRVVYTQLSAEKRSLTPSRSMVTVHLLFACFRHSPTAVDGSLYEVCAPSVGFR